MVSKYLIGLTLSILIFTQVFDGWDVTYENYRVTPHFRWLGATILLNITINITILVNYTQTKVTKCVITLS